MPMTCCVALCLRSTSIPMNSRCRIPLCFVTCAGGARCARAGKIVRRIWRGHRPVKLGKVATIGATIVKTPWRSRCSSPCEAVRRPRRSANVPPISPEKVCDMKAADVMVSAVISVRPNARVEDVASILLANRISAVPVIDEQDELLGIVSEGDLMIYLIVYRAGHVWGLDAWAEKLSFVEPSPSLRFLVA